MTELLGVLKWEPPLPVGMGGKVKGPFPGFLPKTDETRVQVLEAVLERHRGKTFYVTEKLDGTSFTAFLRQGEFGICSRNLWMDEADESNVLVRVAKGLKLEEKLRAARDRLGFDLAIQAEVIGPGIQKNKYGLPAVDAPGLQRPERGRLPAARPRGDAGVPGRDGARIGAPARDAGARTTPSTSWWPSPKGRACSTRRSSGKASCFARSRRSTTRTSAAG